MDEKNELVYFMGMKDTPLEKHLYVIGLLLKLFSPDILNKLAYVGLFISYIMNEKFRTSLISDWK